jgi:hypothetical protein
MQGMLHVLERVAFQRFESRLASALLDRAEGDRVSATHQELATAIGAGGAGVGRRPRARAPARRRGPDRRARRGGPPSASEARPGRECD